MRRALTFALILILLSAGRNVRLEDPREVGTWENRAMTKLAMPLPMDQIRAFCEKWKVARLEVFGSILRDDFRPDSDVDFLVTWKAETRWRFADYLRAEQELAGIIGRKVDLIERDAVQDSRNWLRKSRILSSAEVVHAA